MQTKPVSINNLKEFSMLLSTFGKSMDMIFSLSELVLKNVSGLKSENKDLKEQMEKTHHEYLILLQMLSNIFAMICELEVKIGKRNPK